MKPYAKNSLEVLAHVDRSKPVHVYRNLHKDCFSVRQGGIVVCHAENVVLRWAEFVVGVAGRERVRKERKKNVHAYVKGFAFPASSTYDMLPFAWEKVYYNPYTCDFFKCDQDYVRGAEWVDLAIDQFTPEILAFNLRLQH